MDAFKKFRKKIRGEKVHSQPSQTPPHMANASTSSLPSGTTANVPPASVSDDQPPKRRTGQSSQSAPWIERVLFLLKTAKEGAELGGDLAAPLKAACGITITLLEAVQATNENREAWRELIETIKDHNESFESGLQLGEIDRDDDAPLAKALEKYETLTLEVLRNVLEAAPDTIAAEEVQKASSLAKLRDLAKRLGVSKWEASSIKQYRDRLNDSQRNIMSTLMIYVAARTERRDEDRILETLRVAGLDNLTQPGGCMDGTRLDILKSILQWSLDTSQPNILWVKGHPGCGKSAIARSAAKQFKAADGVDLGSMFAFHRQQASLLNPSTLWRTVAFDLAQKLPAVRRSLAKRLKAKEITLNTSDIDELFQQLIVDSLSSITDPKPIVIVVDALDECGGVDGRISKDRAALMRALKKWPSLPSSVKLLVTSRAEEDVERTFRPTSVHHLIFEIPVGNNADPSSQASKDIFLFLTTEFEAIAERYASSLGSHWPGPDIINMLTKRASGLFIWAATVVRLVNEDEPVEALEHILDQLSGDSLGVLYAQILSSVFKSPKDGDLRNFHAIVGAIVLAETPLSASALSHLLEIKLTAVDRICQGLQSVLETESLLRFRHQSFVDFLLSPDASVEQFGIRIGREHATLALGCFRTMAKDLRFNICDFPSSYMSNLDVPNIESKISEHIPLGLLYASCYWGRHLDYMTPEDKDIEELVRLIHQFQHEKTLFWLEVLSLTQRLILGSSALGSLIRWLQKHRIHQDSTDSVDFANDVLRFIGLFWGAIARSTPHIYLSALPLAPLQSMVAQNYKALYPQVISIWSGGNSSWPTLYSAITGHTARVASVAFSRDSSHVVSGSWDNTIRIWDATSGEAVGEPFRGHTDYVQSVAFSVDASLIVSGSNDETIQIWDAANGGIVGEPLRGHTGQVNSVAFSGDGLRIVSGSHDNTVRIWDVASREAVGEPLRGHTSSVLSVALSGDGSRIVSGSMDNTIRIWDTASGQTVGKPLRGHTSRVNSVAFSEDGSRIVSGSGDSMVRIWNAASGQLIGEPLGGHTGWVISVAFSGDGSRIVSGSTDNTVQIWDAASGQAVGEPLRGHTSMVFSVGFSGDGSRIVSGSEDKTVRIWDAVGGQSAGGSLGGHTGSVFSVALSGDGSRIISGSHDNTIRIWDAASGDAVGEPLRGHNSSVFSVAFSGDGSRIVSGSLDNTLRIWDAISGEPVGEPLRGHTGTVNSVAFSRDDSRIVSGSVDNMVRIWDGASGEAIGEPLRGHTSLVFSVAFSGDGSRIVSGSSDNTLRIWDAASGEPVGEPLRGHISPVNSVSFSGDGSRIVSGSDDKTIRIWDAVNGETIGEPLRGHTGSVFSVAFSADGSCIGSGAQDHTIRIWDATSGKAVGEPFRGHTSAVSSVAFSADGLRIVSGSRDSTIRIWDIANGEAVGGQLSGHNNSVQSVAFPADGSCAISGSHDKADQGLDPLFLPIPKSNLSSLLPFAQFPLIHSDGWIYGPNRELVLWVPVDMRLGFTLLNCKIAGGHFIHTTVDPRHFRHGSSWTQCRDSLSD